MLELLLCSMLTILPDYLYRRYGQGKRLGKEITLYSVWFELRWGIVTCLLLTVALITTVFYFHPSTNSVVASFRAVPIVSETNGRVAEIFVGMSDDVKSGDPIFRLDDAQQRAAVETARRRVAELDAQMIQGRADIAAAAGQAEQARSALQQAIDELETKQELNRRSADVVARREIEKLENAVKARQGALDAAEAQRQAVELKVGRVLPAQKASAEATLAEAEVALDKTTIRAGITGRVEQFALRVGDIVNPFARPAGVLIPAEGGRRALAAGFSQIEAQVIKPGMIAEASCISKPWTVIPMVVASVQDAIAAGQFRAGDQLIDVQQTVRPGTILAVLEPLYPGGLSGVTPGSSCIANAYTSNHELLATQNVGMLRRFGLHMVDAVGMVHAILLRIQVLILPVRDLVFRGH
ncbi:HlyD family secretion protein [Pseudorhodoplanes sp.]|uniref:HlyD family secretion protein n=1 Tax=Pseudorhodoplanes sp. TaxID=1934341 RepID=UPI00391B9726